MIDHRLTTLRTFVACGTISATAELTGFSPSAVSAQLRELQRTLGMTLLVKDGRGLRLTATGRDLVRRSDALVADWERIRAAALSAGQHSQTRFGIGGFSTAAANLLAPLAAQLRRSHPEVEVRLVEAEPARCLDLLTSERLDLAVIVAAQAALRTDDDPRFEQVELLNDPLDVMMPSGHPLATRGSVTLAELEGEAWITDAAGQPYHTLFMAAFHAAGLTPTIAHEVVEWETAMAMVGAGLGLGLLPRLVSIERHINLTRVRLTGAAPPIRKIMAVVRRGSLESPLIAESLEMLHVAAREIMRTRLRGDA